MFKKKDFISATYIDGAPKHIREIAQDEGASSKDSIFGSKKKKPGMGEWDPDVYEAWEEVKDKHKETN